jgi:hypothetical protein
MARPIKIDPQSVLAERLRAEARDSRPVFSEALHARICDAVWQCGVLPAPRRMFRRSVGLAGVAAIAASLLAAAILLGPTRQPPPPLIAGKTPSPAAPSPVSQTPSTSESGFELVTDLTDRATEQFDSLVGAADQWAYLDHDARLVFESLSERLPISLVTLSSSEPSDPVDVSSGL